jgi:HK97 family phage major capsid protein/HK97 family phage prohead protease
MELRFNQSDIQTYEDGSMTVSGYVNKTEQFSELLGHSQRFKEKIAKGAFSNAIKKAKEIHFLAEHDSNQILASTRNDSLKLTEDENGLYMSATISPTSWGKDYYELIKSGILQNMSFGFRAIKDSWKKNVQGYFERTVQDLDLFEVSVVRDPAYSQSSISARGIDVLEDIEIPAEVINGGTKEMNKKALIEQRNEMLVELEEILTTVETEKRGLTDGESTRSAELRLKIEQIDKQIKQNGKEVNKMEVLSVTERNEKNTLEFEKRAIKGVLKGDYTEARDIGMGSNPGSLMVPTNVSAYIVRKLQEVAPLFALTKQFPSSSGFLSLLKESDLGSAQWLDEYESASSSDFAMDSVKLQQKRVTAAVELSQQLVNDAAFDVVTYALDLLVRRLSYAIDRSIINGDGVKQPLGILNATLPTESIVETEAVGTISVDDILGLYNSMNPKLVEGSVFVVSRPVFNALSKLKDSIGNFYLVDFKNGNNGTPMYQILGLPVLISDVMPQSVATGNKAVALINFGESYAVMVKKAFEMKHIFADTTQALRGSHLLLTDAYLDGNIINEQAIRILTVQ